MQKAELVFIPSPGIGHLTPTVELARLLINNNARLSATVLIMKLPFDDNFTSYTKSLTAATIPHRLRFINLPPNKTGLDSNSKDIVSSYMESYKPHIREAVSGLSRPRLAGIVFDMFTSMMMDVAHEIRVPSYVFFTSSAATLNLMFYLENFHGKNKDMVEFMDLDAKLVVPSFVNPVPARVLPSPLLNKDTAPSFLNLATRYREAEGIIINTFHDLESLAINFLSKGISPRVYPVGPVLNINRDNNNKNVIMEWLNDQPPLSVVFLCFGSMGSLDGNQVKEIAHALEHCGHRFLWSLRRPPHRGTIAFPGDYETPEEILPKGFLDRTAGIGLVIGWAPQVEILAHAAIGGFVSHCGWNSVLESLWFGVPIAAWPMEGEQQMNAFEMVIELGLAVEIKMDYRRELFVDDGNIVSREEIEKGIMCLMENSSEIRKRVKDISEKSRKALVDGGSSNSSMARLIQDVLNNLTLHCKL